MFISNKHLAAGVAGRKPYLQNPWLSRINLILLKTSSYFSSNLKFLCRATEGNFLSQQDEIKGKHHISYCFILQVTSSVT